MRNTSAAARSRQARRRRDRTAAARRPRADRAVAVHHAPARVPTLEGSSDTPSRSCARRRTHAARGPALPRRADRRCVWCRTDSSPRCRVFLFSTAAPARSPAWPGRRPVRQARSTGSTAPAPPRKHARSRRRTRNRAQPSCAHARHEAPPGNARISAIGHGDEFIRRMRLFDTAGAAHHGRHARVLEMRRLGTEREPCPAAAGGAGVGTQRARQSGDSPPAARYRAPASPTAASPLKPASRRTDFISGSSCAVTSPTCTIHTGVIHAHCAQCGGPTNAVRVRIPPPCGDDPALLAEFMGHGHGATRARDEIGAAEAGFTVTPLSVMPVLDTAPQAEIAALARALCADPGAAGGGPGKSRSVPRRRISRTRGMPGRGVRPRQYRTGAYGE